MKDSSVQRHCVRNASGTRLTLLQYRFDDESVGITDSELASERKALENACVILSHGTFSNHRSCRGLAIYLAKRGFDCFVLDFQGHGESDRPVIDPDFESMCLEDVQAVVSFVERTKPGKKILWIGHSGGGLAALMYLARNPEKQSTVVGLVTLASQATHAGIKKKNRIVIRLARVFTRLLNLAPGRWFGLGPENEFPKVMLQWFDWSLSGKWIGTDGFDYESSLKNITVPLLCFAGSGDKFIAPIVGCKYLYDSCGSVSKQFHSCNIDEGYAENYTHSRIMLSSSAAREIWPKIAKWLVDLD